MIDVVTAVFIKDKQVLVVKPRSSSKTNKYTLVGGKVKQGESYVDAIIREVFEEVGVVVAEEELNLILEFDERAASDDNTKIKMHMFLVKTSLDKLPSLNDEILDWAWIDFNSNNEELSDSIKYHLLPYLRTLFL